MITTVDWRRLANCADLTDPDFMYWEDGRSSDRVEAAKKVCRRCPVARDCLTDAMDAGREFSDWHGVRAGLTGDFRKKHKWTSVDRLLYLAGHTGPPEEADRG